MGELFNNLILNHTILEGKVGWGVLFNNLILNHTILEGLVGWGGLFNNLNTINLEGLV